MIFILVIKKLIIIKIMSNLLKGKNKSSLQFRTYNNNYISPYNKKQSIYFRDTIKQFCPHQRFVDHRTYPIRTFSRPPIDFNYYNNPTEKDSFVPCFINYPKRELRPLVTRQDLVKFLKTNGRLLNHHRPCNSCNRINNGNYGRNYYTIYQKSFPFINGNFTGTNFRIRTGYQTPIGGGTRYKLRNYDYKGDDYNQFNNECDENENKSEKIKNETNLKDKNKMASSDYFATNPKKLRKFHKTQIFNHYKPFMVDDFKEYADYE